MTLCCCAVGCKGSLTALLLLCSQRSPSLGSASCVVSSLRSGMHSGLHGAQCECTRSLARPALAMHRSVETGGGFDLYAIVVI